MTILSQHRPERHYTALTIESLDYFVHLDEALKEKIVLNVYLGEQYGRVALLQRMHKDGTVKKFVGYTCMDSLENALRIVTAQYLARAPDEHPRCDFADTDATSLLDLWIVMGRRIRASSPDGKNVYIELSDNRKNPLYVIRDSTFNTAYEDAEDYLRELIS